MNDERLAQTFVELADTLVDEFDLLQVMASSSENVRLLELFQLQNDDGPCLDCYRTGQPVAHPDLAAAGDRWPRFAPAAAEAGFRTVHALPMRLRAEILGAFNLFHTDPNQLDRSVTQIGQAMVDVATIGLIQERSLRHHETLTDQLQTALHNRIIVEQAMGVLAERRGINPSEAFVLLRKYARSHQQRLTEFAAAVVDGSTAATELLRTTTT